ncbi:MAG TPA: RDD family protein, partial [Candidatus Obscuribacter sp.]|nr:RDD family protein [Candidatus Obscuribacter sp.]
MNEKQRRLLMVAGGLILLTLAFPPFVVNLPNGAAINKGYGFIFAPPEHGFFSATVNVATLMAEWLAIAILAGVGWMLTGNQGSAPASANSTPFGGAATQKPGGSAPKVLRAGFWARVGACLLDYLLLYACFFVVFTILGLMGAVTPESAERTGAGWGVLVFWLYFALQESGPHQATLGKRALSIKVVTLDGV